MKFPLFHTGKRFFFLTIAVEGRLPVLSRLVRGEQRPILTPAGEILKAEWLSVHDEYDNCLTAGDFVIMPDHAHFLLMANSEEYHHFHPIPFARRFMRRAENAMASLSAEKRGNAPRQPMPGVRGRQAPVVCQGCGGRTPAIDRISFETNVWVEISFDARQLKAIRRYIKMNPARYFWKLDHPDFFLRHANLRHPALDPRFTWSACGDLTLLASPFLYHVRLTSKKPVAEQEADIVAHLHRAMRGGIPVCGFLSPAEREFGRCLKQIPNVRWVKTVPYPLPPRYDPSVEDSENLAAGRELILSSFRDEDAAPFSVKRVNCLVMNDRIAALCASITEK